MTDGDSVRDSDWFFDGGYTGEYSQGFYMSRTEIAAPYLFTGDFEAEFEFYLKLVGGVDDYIRAVDGDLRGRRAFHRIRPVHSRT